jgi:hypothetical protein
MPTSSDAAHDICTIELGGCVGRVCRVGVVADGWVARVVALVREDMDKPFKCPTCPKRRTRSGMCGTCKKVIAASAAARAKERAARQAKRAAEVDRDGSGEREARMLARGRGVPNG